MNSMSFQTCQISAPFLWEEMFSILLCALYLKVGNEAAKITNQTFHRYSRSSWANLHSLDMIIPPVH